MIDLETLTFSTNDETRVVLIEGAVCDLCGFTAVLIFDLLFLLFTCLEWLVGVSRNEVTLTQFLLLVELNLKIGGSHTLTQARLIVALFIEVVEFQRVVSIFFLMDIKIFHWLLRRSRDTLFRTI